MKAPWRTLRRLLEIESQYHLGRPGGQAICFLVANFLVATLLAADAAAQTTPSNEELARRIEALAQELEDRQHGEVAGKLESHWGLGPAASKVYGVEHGLSFGGYGEMLYQDFARERENGTPSNLQPEIDFLRFVLYAGYRFDEHVLVNAEIEFEHASTGEGGEVSVEFAHLDFLFDPAYNGRAGMLLVPMGIINEMHEPPTFFGARRPEVELRLLPTTWRANGAGIFGTAPGSLAGLSYRAYLIESLSSVGAEAFTAGGLRSGRQNGARAVAEDLAGVVRLEYERSGVSGGGSVFFGNTSQGAVDGSGLPFAAFTTLAEGHVQVHRRGVTMRALVAGAQVDDAAAINAANGYTGNASVGSELLGWYAEAGWDVLTVLSPGSRFGFVPFVRYSELDTQKEVPAGFSANPANDQTILTVGASFFPHSQVVFKGDYESRRNQADTGVDQWNLSLGFHF